MKGVFSKMMWAGRATVFAVGVAVILAVVLGVATMALAANGQPFLLGKVNVATAVSKLVKQGSGPALSLRVDSGPPLAVNSTRKVTNLNVDRLDGEDSTDFARARMRTVVVSPVGGAAQNGTALKNALDGITGASQSNPYLLEVEPGVYNLGTSPGLTMKPWVDIEGSGEGITTLIATGSANANTGTVVGAANAELRFLTVKSTGGDDPTAIYSTANPFRMTHVTANASGGGEIAVKTGVRIAGGAATLSQTTATATGANDNNGVMIDGGGTATLNGSTVTAPGDLPGNDTYGIFNTGDVQVRDSEVAGGRAAIVSFAGGTARVAASQIDGGAVPEPPGTLTCAGVYNENYAFFANTCP